MSAVAPGDRSWFEAHYGAARHITVHEAVRRVLEAGVAPGDVRRAEPHFFQASESGIATLQASPVASSAWRCALDVYAARGSDAAAVRAVMQFAAEARARGIVRRWKALGSLTGSDSPWRLRALGEAPWDPALTATVTRDLRDAILWRALGVDARQGPFDGWRHAADCGG